MFAMAVAVSVAPSPVSAVHTGDHEAWGSKPKRRRSRVISYALGRWRVDIKQDAFSRTIQCRLYSRRDHVDYKPGALGFQFRHNLDTTNAWFRIDNGPPVRWQERLPQLLQAGVTLDGPSLSNPTGGTVWLPLTEVMHSRFVDIRPNDRHRPKRFVLGTFTGLLEAARSSGCVPERAFAP